MIYHSESLQAAKNLKPHHRQQIIVLNLQSDLTDTHRFIQIVNLVQLNIIKHIFSLCDPQLSDPRTHIAHRIGEQPEPGKLNLTTGFRFNYQFFQLVMCFWHPNTPTNPTKHSVITGARLIRIEFR